MGRKSKEYKEAVRLMGEKVVVFKRMVRHYDSKTPEVTWNAIETEPCVGWVTGIRWKQPGKILHKYERGGYFERSGHSKVIPVLLVVEWPTKNPLFVPFDGYREATGSDGSPKPTWWGWDEQDRAEISEEAKNAPRDKRGRFVSLYQERNDVRS